MPRLSEANITRVKKYMAQLLRDKAESVAGRDNETSPTKIATCIKKDLGLTVTRQTISAYLKQGVDGYLKPTNVGNNKAIKEYNDVMASAKDIWDNTDNKPAERKKAYSSYLLAKKQKEALEKDLTLREVEKAEATKPNYLIKIVPKSALRTCPKCGHKYYDIGENDESKDTKTISASETVSTSEPEET